LGVERLAAVAARVLELAHAVRAAQEVLLHVLLAVRADEVAALLQPRLGRLHLELAGVAERPVDERQPHHDQHEDQQLDGCVQAVVVDSEDGHEGHGAGRR
jgi:hypothetical protein